MNILKAIAVNILAVVAFPFLIIGTIFKLFSKSLEKIAFIFCAILILFGIYLIHDMVYNGGETIGMIFITLFFFGAIILILLLIFLLASSICLTLIQLVSTVLDGLNAASMFIFNSLMNKCEGLRDSMPYGSCVRIICLLETIVLAIRWVILHLFALAFPLSCVLSFLLVLGAPIYANIRLQSIMGINLIQYLKLFSGTTLFFTILYLIVFLAAVVIIFLCLGIEWTEWASEELDQSGGNSSATPFEESVIIIENPQKSVQNLSDSCPTISMSPDSQ